MVEKQSTLFDSDSKKNLNRMISKYTSKNFGMFTTTLIELIDTSTALCRTFPVKIHKNIARCRPFCRELKRTRAFKSLKRWV